MGEIITNALIRKDNPLAVNVDSFGVANLVGKDGIDKPVTLVKLNFRGLNGSEDYSALGPSEFGYVCEQFVYEVHVADRINPIYCKSMHSVWDGFARVETINGRRREILKETIETVVYKKLVKVEYMGEAFFFLLHENAVIASSLPGFDKILYSSYSLKNYIEVINGF